MPRSIPRQAYLTIDDAPSPDTRRKLAVLDDRSVTATWFCRGELIEARPDDARSIIEHGHVIGNHSFDHPRFSRLSLDACIDQVTRTEAAIDAVHAATGIPRRSRLFRFPFGDKGDGIDDPSQRPAIPAPRVVALQAHLRMAGFRCPPFAGVSWPWYVQGGYGTNVIKLRSIC